MHSKLLLIYFMVNIKQRVVGKRDNFRVNEFETLKKIAENKIRCMYARCQVDLITEQLKQTR